MLGAAHADAVPAPDPTFVMTSTTVSEPLQAARFQITTATTARVGQVTVALPASMVNGAVMRVVTTLPAGTISRVSGGIAYRVTNPVSLAAGTRIWLTVSGIATPSSTSLAPMIQVWATNGARVGYGIAPAMQFSAKPACPTAGWPKDYIATENALPGTSAWKIAKPGAISAYAELSSAKCGNNVYIRSNGKLNGVVRMTIYRMGYYGGAGARAVWSQPVGPWLLGDAQPAPLFIARNSSGQTINEVKATNWRRTFGFAVDGRFPPGTYLIALTDNTGTGSYVPLTIRDDIAPHAYTMLSSTNTWQAYNLFGNYDAYTSPRSSTISYDRPYAQNAGSGDFLGFEFGYVFWAEKQGLDSNYTTDVQLHYNPSTIAKGTLVIPGHAEYWSPSMRTNLVSSIAGGTNVLSLSSNSIYWQINPLSQREFQAFKGNYGLQSRFRTAGLPEQSILGGMYDGCYQVDGTGVANTTSWLWNGVAAGTKIPHLAAAEVDHVVGGYPVPAGSKVLDTIPLSRCSGSTPTTPQPAHMYMQVTIVDPGNGQGRVFHAGSIGWGCALSDQCIAYGTPYSVTTAGALAVGQATMNAIGWLDTGESPVIEPPPALEPGTLRLKGGLPTWVDHPHE